MGRFRFTQDRAGIARLMRGREIGHHVDRAAQAAADAARAHAPVGPGLGSGSYEDSIRAEPARLGPDGWSAELVSDDPFWHLIEFGSVNNPPYRPLTRGTQDAGLDFTDGG